MLSMRSTIITKRKELKKREPSVPKVKINYKMLRINRIKLPISLFTTLVISIFMINPSLKHPKAPNNAIILRSSGQVKMAGCLTMYLIKVSAARAGPSHQ